MTKPLNAKQKRINAIISQFKRNVKKHGITIKPGMNKREFWARVYGKADTRQMCGVPLNDA